MKSSKLDLLGIMIGIPAYVYLAWNLSIFKYGIAALLIVLAVLGSRLIGYEEGKRR